jgi:hypothetical protein
MDVARYADTKGYVFTEDRNYPTAYTYRNWLIEAFNNDLPYDRFIVDQLAADRLPEVQSKSERAPLAAMGFLTLGRRFINSQPDIIDDRIDVTMRGFQGFTVACARCHDHKFDPIPTQDYYSLYAVFASSEEETDPVSPNSVSVPWESYSKQLAALESSIRDIVQDQLKKLRSQNQDLLSPEIKKLLEATKPGVDPSDDVVAKMLPAFESAERDRLTALQKDRTLLMSKAPATPDFALDMHDRPNPADGVVFHHGNPGNLGIPAPRRFLLALSKAGVDREHWTRGSGRLELARAIASKDNPLTARVFVNRVWQDHFGMGIVRTPSDFGHQGEKPTDPKLLDYLAATFMESGWSIKKLHRLIVTSATYCQSSSASQAAMNADPDNRNWGRMNRRRLDLEEMRDTLMTAAGRLRLDMIGGKSVDIWSEPFTARRAVYGFIERQNLPFIFRAFDFASPDSTSARRFQTTVPQQALFFMNSPFVVEEARLVAERPEISMAKDDGQRIRRLYLLLFGRLPDKLETEAAMDYFRSQPKDVQVALQDWTYGFGTYRPATQSVDAFVPFTHFSPAMYNPSEHFPDPQLGYAMISSAGGHPGRDADHAVVRRWTAHSPGQIQIEGVLRHRQKEGDGIRGRIVSSRKGLLGEWLVHNGQAKTDVMSTDVRSGDTIDFIVDCVTNDAYDGFEWSPVVHRVDRSQSWSASALFGPPAPSPVSRVGLYVQALMMSNEFMFVD